MLKYKFIDEKRKDEKLNETDNGFEIKSRDVFRLAPNNHILIKTGIEIEFSCEQKIIVKIDPIKSLNLGLTVLNPFNVTNYSGTNELEILIHNLSNKTAIVNYGEALAYFTVLYMNSPLVEKSLFEKDLQDKEVELEVKKPKKTKKPKEENKKVLGTPSEGKIVLD